MSEHIYTLARDEAIKIVPFELSLADQEFVAFIERLHNARFGMEAIDHMGIPERYLRPTLEGDRNA